MKKSVYSLVLSDDVIRAIDELAYSMNTSRSNLINQILAERVSYKTPESIMRDVFNCMRTIMDSHFQIQGQASDAMLSIRSPLRYKYKPTIRYRVELLKETENGQLGRLSVTLRTQNAQLLMLFEEFFKLWYNLEKHYMSGYFKDGMEYSYGGGKFIRSLKVSDKVNHNDPDVLGKTIGSYVRLIDNEIKTFFEETDNPGMAAIKMEKMLSDSIESGIII